MEGVLGATRAVRTVPADGRQVSGSRLTRRRWVLAVVPAASVAAACAPSIGGQAAELQRSQQPVTIRHSTFTFAEPARREVILPGIREFEERTGHKVEFEPADVTKFVVQFAAGSAADMPQAANYLMPRLFDQNAIQDLTAYVNRDKINLRRDYGLMGLEFWGGKILVMPLILSPHAWYYNKSLLKEVGAPDPWDTLKGDVTWDDLLAMARAVTRPAQGDQPARWGVQLMYNDVEFSLGGFVWSNGGRTHDWGQLKYAMDLPKSIEAVQWVHDLLHKHRVMIPSGTVAQLRQGGIAEALVAGRVALVEHATSRLLPFQPSPFEWDVFPIPRVSKSGPPAVTYTSGDPNSVNAATSKKDQAWALARWLAGPVIQNLLGKSKGQYPALMEAAADSKGFAAPPPAHMKVFADVFKGKVFRRFFHYNHIDGINIYKKWLDQAFDESSIGVEQALREATREANATVEIGRTRPTFPD